MRRSTLLLSSLLPLLLTGCIDDPTAVEEEGAPILSEQEIEFLGLTALAKSLEAQENAEDSTAISADGVSAVRSILLGGPAAAPVVLNEAVSTSVPCDFGGEMAVDLTLQGELDDETDVGEITLTMTLTPDFCGVESDAGFRATLFGDPAFATTIRLESDGSGVVQISGGITGGLGALTGGRVASCQFDLSFSGTQTEAGGDIQVEGTACGEAISTSLNGSEAAT
jgi:hypothetical protein